MLFKTTFLSFLLWFVTSMIHPGQWSGSPGEESDSKADAFGDAIEQVYKSLHEPSLSSEAFRHAMLGYRSLCLKGLVTTDSILTIIDYSLPSSEDRFFVINLKKNKVIHKTLVSHGRNSGDLYASRFSNRAQSHQSALGFYITGAPYEGGQGYSMRLMGVDTGYNDHAQIRSIVVHGARYATHQYIKQYGRLGRSFGCPALSPRLNTEIINCIKDGSVLFSYYPDAVYLNNSPVLGSVTQEEALAKPVL